MTELQAPHATALPDRFPSGVPGLTALAEHAPALPARLPRGVTVRRLVTGDAEALEGLGPESRWIHGTDCR
ncbi:hypothetical protein [Streptomyces sp. NPDC001389]|uniref:hypothetical protein n=1 Tax=Streptomyces sp. NPDC001389 TaxID=3364569 RepID=UPI0036A87EDE